MEAKKDKEFKTISCGIECMLSMILIVFLDMVGVGIVIPILAATILDVNRGILPAAAALPFRTMLYGFLIAAYPLAQFFGAPILGALSDRHGRKKILLLSLLGTFIGYIIFGAGIVMKNIPMLFLSRIIDGFTGGNISIAQSAIADVSTPKAKARNFGLISMAFGVGFILGPFIGGQLANPALVPWFSQSTPFFFAAALCLFNIFLLIRFFPETLITRADTRVSLMTGFRNIGRAFHLQNLRTMFIVIFLLAFGFNFFTQFIQVFLIERFRFDEVMIGNYFAYVGIWIAFAQGFVTRPLTKRFSSQQILSVSALMLGLTLPLQLLPRQAMYLYFITPFIALFQGLTYPNSTAIISNLSGRESQGEVLGINQSIQSLAMAIPPIIAGLVASVDIGLPIMLASGITILAWLIFVTAYREGEKKTFHEV